MKTFKELIEQLIEAKISGLKYKKVIDWIKANGFVEHRTTGKEPMYKHSVTGRMLRGVNSHKGDVDIGAARNVKRDITKHHTEHGLKMIELGER